jgi:cell division control protein 24
LKYQDEDMDYVMLEGEDDWEIVKDWIEETNQKILTVFAF